MTQEGTLLVVIGPTGVGKTETALRLAERYGCPIINADSRQVYREIPIGTAAPTAAEQRRVKHYFVGTRSVTEDYNAGAYARDCEEVLRKVKGEGDPKNLQIFRGSPGERLKVKGEMGDEPFAILTGGSMLYIDAVCEGLDDIPSVRPETRRQVQEAYREKGLPWLQEEVALRDPQYWQQVDRQNPQRLMHCLEICLETGLAYSTFRKSKVESQKSKDDSRKSKVESQKAIVESQKPWRIVKIGLEREREELYERINRRVAQMIADGLEEEARRVYPLRHLNSLNTVGYKEMFAYIDGRLTLDEAIKMIQQNSRHYAKRQMTWFRRQKDIHWLNAAENYETQLAFIDTCLAAR